MRCHNNPEIVGFCEDVIDPQYVMPSPYYTASVFNRNDMCDIIHNKKKNIGARNLAMLIRQLFNTLKLDSNIYFIKMCMTNVLCIVGHSTLPVEYAQSVYEFAPNVFKVFMWSTINANTYKEVKMQKSIPIHEVVMTRPEFTKHNMDLIFNATFTNQDFVSKANIGVYTANLFKSLLPAEKTLLFDHILQHAKSPNLTRADLKRAGITRS
jgi:hypothetical protein